MSFKEKNIDPIEIAKFDRLAAHWWDKEGEFKTLHQINPLRLQYINQYVDLAKKTVLDIGCGGGILAEGMAKLGANVTGIDMSPQVLGVAKLHQQVSGLSIQYHLTTAEEFALQQAEQFDVITCLEMLEHVPCPKAIIQSCAKLAKPGGKIFFSTLNRNIKSYLYAIVGAEYLLKLLPKNTHDYAKFIRPSELADWARESHLTLQNMAGLSYQPLTKEYRLNQDVSVNYLAYFQKLS